MPYVRVIDKINKFPPAQASYRWETFWFYIIYEKSRQLPVIYVFIQLIYILLSAVLIRGSLTVDGTLQLSLIDNLLIVDGTLQLLLIVIEDIATSIKKNQITMKIEPLTYIWMFVDAMNFELPEMSKKWSLGLFRPKARPSSNLPPLGLFHPSFISKTSFR